MGDAKRACLSALSDLVDDVRGERDHHGLLGHEHYADAFNDIALTLDRVRTRLVEDGDDYLDAAFAFLDAGRNLIARFKFRVSAEGCCHVCA